MLGEVGDAEFLVVRPGEEAILRRTHDGEPERVAADLAEYVARAVF